MRVIAINRGYYGGEIRDPGDDFEIPDKDWRVKSHRPSWVEPVDKGEGHDDGDDEPLSPAGQNPANIPKAADGKEPAKRGRRPKAEAKPADEPKGNGVTEELGTDPDWLPPGADDSDDAADSN